MAYPVRRKRPDPLSIGAIAQETIKKLVKPEKFYDKGFWGKEMRALNRLKKIYPDEDFWLNLRPHEKLDSLYYLFTEPGRAAIREFWVAHQLEKEDMQKWVDKLVIETRVEDEYSEEPIQKKVSNLDWADDK